jgi:predicted DCC family thiol-disulfide oxidoreductase YuxK
MFNLLVKNKTKPVDLVVLYDGKCPHCGREIRHYMRLDTQQRIRWLDIEENPGYLQKHNITWTNAMKKLHSIENGAIVRIGVESFIEIWCRIDRYRFLSRVVSVRPVYVVVGIIYDTFATRRFNRRCMSQTTCKPRTPSLT